jgi:hypothetical protein
MALFVVPYRADGRLGWRPRDRFGDVPRRASACEQIGEVRICDAPGGQNAALAATLSTLEGPVAIVNS